MKRNTVALLLAILMCVSVFVACGTDSPATSSTETSNPETESKSSADVSETSEETSDENSFYGYTLKHPEGYGGAEIKIFTSYVSDSSYYQYSPKSDPDYDETDTNVVHQALVERTDDVEAALGVKITEIPMYTSSRTGAGPTYDAITNNMMSEEEDVYDVVVPPLRDCASLAVEGYLLDLASEVPGLDLSREWWSQEFNRDTSINGKIFFSCNDASIISKEATMFVAYNKSMLEKYGLLSDYDADTLYQLVDEKRWTWDVLFEMSKAVYEDTNESGICDQGDINGLAGQDSLVAWMLFAGGARIASKDSDGYPELSLYSERTVRLIDDCQTYIQNTKNGFISANDYFNVSSIPVSDVTAPEFVAGRCLFFMDAIMNLENIRGMTDSFGIVPMPMYDDTQSNYSSSISYWSADAICITTAYANDTARLEMVADVLQALGAVSVEKVNKVYYAQTLKNQLLRDEEDERMLDIIFSTRSIDLANVYNWGEVFSVVNEMFDSAVGTFTSSYKEIEEAAEQEIADTIDAFRNR